jgi:hypothetical protein
MDEWPVPSIRAQCSKCYKWRDVRFEMHCGFCGSAAIMAATAENVRTASRFASPELPPWKVVRGRVDEYAKWMMGGDGLPLSAGEKASCAELDKLFALEDKR